MDRVDFTEGYLFDFYSPVMQQGLKHFEEPKNDNEKLLNLQYEFLTTGSKAAWDRLWSYSLFVTKKMCRKIYKRRKLKHTAEDIYNKAIEATEYVLRRLKNPAYRCNDNFASELYMGCIHAFDYEMQILSNRLQKKAEQMSIEYNIPIDQALVLAKKEIEETRKREGKD